MNKVRIIDIDWLKAMPGALNYDDQFFLYDNMDESVPFDSYYHKNLKNLFPFKLNFMLFMVCYEGSADYTIASRKYTLTGSQVTFMDPYIVLQDFHPKKGFKALMLAFRTDNFLSEAKNVSIMMIRRHLIHPYLMDGNKEEMALIKTIYSFLKDLIVGDIDSRPFKMDAIYGGLLILSTMAAQKIYFLEKDFPSLTEWSQNGIMSRFLSELGKHCKEERSVNYYASKLFISPKYFAQLVLKESGRHAKDWITEYVIRDAKSMLRSGGMTVQEVSNNLNFPNASFFGKYFKKATGMSPKQFMKEK